MKETSRSITQNDWKADNRRCGSTICSVGGLLS